MSRVRRYSRSICTRSDAASPTGLSPSPVTRSSGLQLRRRSQARKLPSPPRCPFNPPQASPAGYAAYGVWAPPRSLAATEGILSFPRGTEMFQFPRCPPRIAPRCPAVCRAGCPIRKPLDRRLPAPPQGISPRGRVLPRPPTPRHPPCALLAEALIHLRLAQIATGAPPRSRTGSRQRDVASPRRKSPLPARTRPSPDTASRDPDRIRPVSSRPRES